MACNYNSFSRNALNIGGGVPDDVQTIQLFEGDQLQAIRIQIKEWNCGGMTPPMVRDEDGVLQPVYEDDPINEWPPFSLRKLSRLMFYFGEINTETILFQGECMIFDPDEGLAYFTFPIDSLDGLEGDYIGYIKAFFDSSRTVTVENKLLFNVLPSHDFLT